MHSDSFPATPHAHGNAQAPAAVGVPHRDAQAASAHHHDHHQHQHHHHDHEHCHHEHGEESDEEMVGMGHAVPREVAQGLVEAKRKLFRPPPSPFSSDHPTHIPITKELVQEAYTLFFTQVAHECAEHFIMEPESLAAHLTTLVAQQVVGEGTAALLEQADAVVVVLVRFVIRDDFFDDRCQDVGEVYKTCLRVHQLGRALFCNLLCDLLRGLDLGAVDRVLAPGCGQFFEAPVVDALFSPFLILGQDLLHHSLHAAMQHNQHLRTVAVQLLDCSQRPSNQRGGEDLAIVVHPNVLDTDVWGSVLEGLAFNDEYVIPFELLQSKFSLDAMSASWKAVITTVVSRLRTNGRLVFVCYERRERQLIEMFLRSLPTVEVERACEGPGNTAFLFVEKPDRAAICVQTFEWVVMKHYHCGIVARKL